MPTVDQDRVCLREADLVRAQVSASVILASLK